MALAADSKVTITTRNGRAKTYDTVNKLFSLSKTEPIGAMIFGGAEFMGFPWETIIKEYRRKEPSRKFDTVKDWSEDFLGYLTDFFSFSEKEEANFVKRFTYSELRQEMELIQSRVEQEYGSNELKHEEITEILSGHFTIEIEKLEKLDDNLSDDEWAKFISRDAEIFSKVVVEGFSGLPEAVVDLAIKFAMLVVKKKRRSTSGSSSGLVLAGFGEKEMLPTLLAFEIDGIISGRLKFLKTEDVDIHRGMNACLIPFAQHDMVQRFMSGVDPHYQDKLISSLENILLSNSITVLESFGVSSDEIEKKRNAIEAALTQSVSGMAEDLVKFQNNKFTVPIIDMVANLPRDELAHLAESLVSLTSLQRKVSADIETVGGPIDVAVISKGDGFVWIKRKHYFPADKNLRFVNNYFSEYS